MCHGAKCRAAQALVPAGGWRPLAARAATTSAERAGRVVMATGRCAPRRVVQTLSGVLASHAAEIVASLTVSFDLDLVSTKNFKSVNSYLDVSM